MAKQLLTVVLAVTDLAAQRDHLARGALFIPVPDPAPEPFAEVSLRVESPSGSFVELDGRVLQILEGRGIAIAFDDMKTAKAKLAPVLSEPATIEGDVATPTLIFWGRPGASLKMRVAETVTRTLPAPAPDPEEQGVLVIEGAPIAPIVGAEERDETAKLRDAIAVMTTNEKTQLALKGDRIARFLLLKEPNKSFQGFILQNPRTTLDEVRYLAGFRQASPEVLQTIAMHKDWGDNPGVVAALVRNPKTPGAIAVRLLDKLGMPEIRRLAKGSDVPRAVQAAARKKVSDAGA